MIRGAMEVRSMNIVHCWWAVGQVTVRSGHIEFDQEEDGRWIAEVPELPGVMVYGQNKEEALSKAQALAFRVLADRIEQRDVDAQFGDVQYP